MSVASRVSLSLNSRPVSSFLSFLFMEERWKKKNKEGEKEERFVSSLERQRGEREETRQRLFYLSLSGISLLPFLYFLLIFFLSFCLFHFSLLKFPLLSRHACSIPQESDGRRLSPSSSSPSPSHLIWSLASSFLLFFFSLSVYRFCLKESKEKERQGTLFSVCLSG